MSLLNSVVGYWAYIRGTYIWWSYIRGGAYIRGGLIIRSLRYITFYCKLFHYNYSNHGRTGRGGGGAEGAAAPPVCWANKASRAIFASQKIFLTTRAQSETESGKFLSFSCNTDVETRLVTRPPCQT